MKHLYFLYIIVFFPILAFGQIEYFLTDSSKSVGINLIYGTDLMNSKLCQVKKDGKIIKYSPYEVEEFGFKDRRVYISKEIQICDSTTKVFLELLHKGNTTLYFYKGINFKTFFIEKDSSLFVEIPKLSLNDRIFNEQLIEITNDCPNIADAIKFVNYNKKSLSKFIARYNNCVLKPFPHFRYGVTIGYEFSLLIPSSDNQTKDLNYFDFSFDNGFTTGLFLDAPIHATDFSLHAEVYYSDHGYSYNSVVENRDLDFVANISSIRIPLIIRYDYPSNKIRPFLNIGMMGTSNIKNETLLYSTTVTENIIEINDNIESPLLIDDVQFGYSIGGGIEFSLNTRNSLFFESNYFNQYGLSNSNSLNVSGYRFVMGINF